jgi:hypothetical protein
VLDAAGQEPEGEYGRVVAVGKAVRPPRDERRVPEPGQGLAQYGVDAQEYGFELVHRLGAGLDGRFLG